MAYRSLAESLLGEISALIGFGIIIIFIILLCAPKKSIVTHNKIKGHQRSLTNLNTKLKENKV